MKINMKINKKQKGPKLTSQGPKLNHNNNFHSKFNTSLQKQQWMKTHFREGHHPF